MLVILSSATAAERVRRLIARWRISGEIVQTPKSISESGCSYALKIKSKDLPFVKKAATQLRLGIKGIYEEESTKGSREYRKREDL